MPAIFISHSSVDREVSGDVKAALTQLGFEHAFLDFDKTTGLDIGESWEKRLYEELSRCHAVVLVLTPAWLASKWCFAELTQARALGKVILPVLCEPLGGQFVLPDIQAADLIDWNTGGLERLEKRLRAITDELARGFMLDPNRPPYPGINAFEKEDAAIYFGRDEESRAVLERLNARRTQGGARVVVIIGASGSGKSSLMKASVLPLLARRRAQWVILPDIRPEKAPMEALAKALAQHTGKPETWRDWHETLRGPEALTAIERFVQDMRIGDARAATVLLPIDQFEEMFTTTPTPERAVALGLLQAACARDIPFMVIATGRSDVLEGLIESSELVGNYETLPLTAMPLERYPRLIEGPAAVAGITVERGLPERIGRDVESNEALPLLAHMLALLYQRGDVGRKLSLAEYEALGDSTRGLNPIHNSIRLAADGAIARVRPNQCELAALRDTFVPHLVRVRLDDGKRVRQTARRSELPSDALRLIGALTEARLLTTRTGEAGQEREPLVEVTHEALFKAWPTLDQWLTEEQAFLTDLERIRAVHEDNAKAPDEQKSGELLYGLLLSRARDWLLKYPQRFISRELEPLRAFIAASAEVADATRARRQRVRRMAFGGMAAVTAIFALIASIAYWQYTVAESARKVARDEKTAAEAARTVAEFSERRASDEKVEAEKQRNRAEEQAKLAIEERNQALIIQSRFLADTAIDISRGGDHGTALALALEALPDARRGIKRPYVAVAESMLYRIVMALREQKTFAIDMGPDERFVRTGSVSTDGRRVLAGTSELNAWLFDAGSGKAIRRINDEQTDVEDAFFTRDGGHLVTTSHDKKVRIYDAADGALIQTLPIAVPEWAGLIILATSRDGRRVVVSGREAPVQVWDAVGGKIMRTFPDSMSDQAGSLSPDGHWLATANHDQVRVWRLDADTPALTIGEVKQENRDEPGVLFFPDSKRLLVSTASGLVRLWDIEQHKPVTTLFEDQRIAGASFSPDGKWLVLIGSKKIFAFNTADFADSTGRVLPTWEASYPVTSLAFSPDSRLLAATSDDGTVRLSHLGASEDGTVLRTHNGPVHAAAFSSDGRHLVTLGRDKTIRIWNGTPGGMVLELAGRIERPSEAVFSPNGRRIVGRSAHGTTIWDLATGVPPANLPAQKLRHAVFLDDKRIAANSDRLHIWDTVSGTVTVIDGDHERMAFVAASPDRKQIALYGALHLWNALDNAPPAPVDAELGLLSSAAFSPDGRRLAVTSTAGVHLIDPVNRKQIAALGAGNPALESVAYSRDGRTLFLGSRAGTLHALDSTTLKPQYTWPLGDNSIMDLKVSPDGARLLAVLQDGIRMFDIATRQEVAVLDSSSSITQAAFSPDGRFIAANSDNLRVWPAFPDTQALIDYARSVMPRPLTAQQRKDYFLEAAATTATPPQR